MSEIKLLIIDNVADTQIVRIRKHDFTEQSRAERLSPSLLSCLL